MSETDFSGLDLAQIRAQRSEAQKPEDAGSFVRRMAQGRLDLACDEKRRGPAGTTGSNSTLNTLPD